MDVVDGTKFLITGGAGSLGKAITKILLSKKMKVAVYSRDEGKHALSPFAKDVENYIGDVRDLDRLSRVFSISKPAVVIHAAALKRIDDIELHPDEAYKTNVVGSENVCKVVLDSWCKAVLVSTDKACKPINVYGATKFIAERTFTNYQYLSNKSPTLKSRFASVRYGNVIASRGSFIPLWLDQISKGQPVTVTSEDCTRFLFTLNDAANFVINTATTWQPNAGAVSVPVLKSYSIKKVLSALMAITGREPQVKLIGMRPGEKLHEDMLADTEIPNTVTAADHRSVLEIRPQYFDTPMMPDQNHYVGKPLNSEFFLDDDLSSLVALIRRGLEESD